MWIFSTLGSAIVNIFSNATAAFKGVAPPELPGPDYFILHPFKTSWHFFIHTLGAEIPYPKVYKSWITGNILTAIVFGLAYFMFKRNKDQDGIQGSSKFAKPSEVKKYLTNKFAPGIMFGTADNKPAILKANTSSNKNVVVFGPPGTGKSATYIRNNLFQAVASGWSVIVTDPKGELTQDFALWFKDRGYTVKIFNLVEMINSDQWNPLKEVHDDISAQHFVNIVIANTKAAGKKGGDDFWDNAETNLLKALVMYVTHEYPVHNRNLGELYNLLASGDSKQLDATFAELPSNHPARLPYNLFREADSKVRAGVVMGLGNRLGVFQNDLVRELTSSNDEDGIDLELPGKEKCAYFCILSDTGSTFNFLASLFFSFLFTNLTQLADKQRNKKLAVPVNFLLDEFCNISGIPDFTKKLSTMRGRDIACSIIVQNIPQLEQAYPNRTWEVILGDCDYWLILGVKEFATAKYMSDVLGNTTVIVESEDRKKGLQGMNPLEGKMKLAPSKRALMDPSELSRMEADESILRIADGKIIKLKKFFYKNYPWAEELIEMHTEDYFPPWAERFKARRGTETQPIEVQAYVDDDDDYVIDDEVEEVPQTQRSSFW
ncbi:VirD4-like conjugal transfer protein, CD1115 family [Pelotomaculum propionicicum]|uniref:VirD4-like conjugal transfer protein, CD1115 family n=1 Tax=Pelotomaculum propionicicum TaxID=258475 RepID=UPI003B7F8EB8